MKFIRYLFAKDTYTVSEVIAFAGLYGAFVSDVIGIGAYLIGVLAIIIISATARSLLGEEK